MNDAIDNSTQVTIADLPVFLVNSRIRNYISEQGLKLSEETVDALNTRVQQIINQAIERTRANKRLTVRPYDL
ncbi:MAG: hypothetical protein H3C43_06830 [Leptonema sp. (in: Bacteria)]|nr:hypothetical protein [Leptonema sp. (in: bacteria)]